jgi:hypothetical protein
MSAKAGVSKASIAAIFFAVTLSGCLGRSVVDIRVPGSSAPQGKAFVKIADIRDLRHFEVAPDRPSDPSVEDAADIANPAVTARAIGRKRNGYGGGAGDVALPEGRTVDDLVLGTVGKVLQDKGYVLVDKDSPNYAAASPLDVEIQRFWAWEAPQGAVTTVYFNAVVIIKGAALVAANDAPIEVHTARTTPFLTDSTWRAVIEQGLTDLATKMAERIKASA